MGQNRNTAQKKVAGKTDRRRTEQKSSRNRAGELDKLEVDGGPRELRTPRKISLKSIMRSVRSISNLRSGR